MQSETYLCKSRPSIILPVSSTPGRSVVLEGEEIFLKKGDVIKIPQGSKHRIGNVADQNLIFIEVQMGTYFGEDDIIRLEDDYFRNQDK